MILDYFSKIFPENSSYIIIRRKITVYVKTGTLHEDQYTFMIGSRLILRIINISGKICGRNKNIFFVQYFVFENRAFYEIMWKNVVETDRPQMTV